MWWLDPKTAPQSQLHPWGGILALLGSALGATHTPQLWETRARPKGKGEGSGTQHSEWEFINSRSQMQEKPQEQVKLPFIGQLDNLV